jgi:DNA-binding GntR family transcriptional regulator
MKPRQHVAMDPWQGICEALRSQILDGTFAPGERLVETTLAEQFGTSRGPVRSALKELERVGLIVTVPRRGTFVRTFTAHDIDEIVSLWRLISPFAVRRAVERCTPEDLARFKALSEDLPPKDDVEAMLDRGVQVHRAVFEMSAHSRLLEIYEWFIAPATVQALMLHVTADVGGDYAEPPADALYRAFESGDAESAVRIATAWTEEVAAYLRSWIVTDDSQLPEAPSTVVTKR